MVIPCCSEHGHALGGGRCPEHQHALLDRFGTIVSKAKRQLPDLEQAAAINGNGRFKEMESQPKEADGVSVAKHERQLPGETSAE